MSQSFPTIAYKCPGPHACTGGTYSYSGAEDEASLSRLLSSGWFRTLPEAISGEHEDNSAPTREELEAKAAELNIAFDGRTTDKKLAEKIDQALASQE